MFAVLYLADFALHAVLRTEPDVAGRPAALFSHHRKKSTVIATTPAARAAGVELGMTAPQAVARCPALVIREPVALAENEARATLLAIAFTLSPAIEDTSPGVCTIDLRGTVLEKTLPAAHTALAELARHGLPATAGLARTPLLALYAAKHLSLPSFSSSFSSGPSSASAPAFPSRPPPGRETKATDKRERSPVLLLAPETESTFLAPLPLAVADPSPELADILAHWGLRTLGDLTALPRDDIIRRFGAAGLGLWQRATGGAARPLRPVVPPQTFSAAMEFEDPVATLEPLLFLLRRFLDRLTLELTTAQFVAAELALTLRLEADTAHTRCFRLPEPTADPEIIFRAVHTHLESLQTASSVVALGLDVTPARPLVRQQGLFDTGLRDPHGFAETLARISALVGPDHLGTPQPEDTHRPDTFKLTPPTPTVPPVAEPPLHAPLSLPLRRFRPPLHVGLTETGEGKLFLWSNDHRGEISFRSAPYFRNGDWWQADRAWSRVEWDVALTEGGLYRLILDGDDYYLEGEYD